MLHLPVEPAEHAVEALVVTKAHISHKSSPLPVGFGVWNWTHVMYCIFRHGKSQPDYHQTSGSALNAKSTSERYLNPYAPTLGT